MKVLGNKFLKVIAFITACILTSSVAFMMSEALIKNSEKLEKNQYYNIENKYSESTNALFVKLWAVANMYMRNLDSEGKFSGNKYLKASTEEAMKSIGLMDSKGNITIDGDEDFEYILKYNDNVISNTQRKEKDFDEEYSLKQLGDVVNYPYGIHIHSKYEMSWYTTNFGMTYYSPSYQITDKSIAVFDFDTTGLPSYYDENGAKIYYKKDGTTPVPDEDTNDYYDPYTEEIVDTVTDDGFEYISGNDRPICIYIRPKENVIKELKADIEEYTAIEDELTQKFVDLIPLGAAAVIIGIFFIIISSYDTEQKKFVLKAPNNIFTEFYFILAFIAILGAGFFIGSFDEIKNLFDNGRISAMPVYYAAAYGFLFAVGLYAVNAIVVQLKCHSMFKTSLIGRFSYRIINFVKRGIGSQMQHRDAMTRRFIIRTIAAVIAEIFTIIIFSNFPFAAAFVLFFSLANLAAYIILTIRDFEDIKNLSEHISALQSGDYTKVKVPETSVIYGMTDNLNKISDGMQTAVEKRVQSERMKIDLVTNVSHDLKTPLTSIISYINLLGSEEMSPEAKDYVKVLEEKSARLKAIVSDLFDLAKATSGTDIAKDKLDAAILTQQVVGDMADKIEKYGKDIRTEVKIESAPVMGDGKKLYRVIQNLIDNALKYSLDGTRIYVNVDKDKSDTLITVKNISAEEMNFTADEITERFARGDSSRSTEGSGLGLSIAKSFTEANGGQFRVLIDGDMFTAEVRLPIINE